MLEGASGDHLFQPSLLDQGHLQPELCSDGFCISPRMETPHLPGQLMPVLSHPHSGKVCPDRQREPPVSWFVPFASGPVTGLHWKEPGSILLVPSLQIFVHMNQIPHKLFVLSRLSSPSSFSLSSQERCPSLFLISVALP